MPDEILEGNIAYLSQRTVSLFVFTEFVFAQLADQILQDPVPLSCLKLKVLKDH